AEEREEVAAILVTGIAAAPHDFVDSALDRMETLDDGLFWEVNERVVAFDWVDPDLRVQIPHLREALRHTSGPRSTEQPREHEAGAQDLVQPQVEIPGP